MGRGQFIRFGSNNPILAVRRVQSRWGTARIVSKLLEEALAMKPPDDCDAVAGR
jgi:hypothetical protein